MSLLGLGLLVWLIADVLLMVVLLVLRERHEHYWLVRLTPTRIFLSCSCGCTTPGWHLFELPPGCQRVTTTRLV